MRGGRYVRQPTGYDAFLPATLPPEPRINYEGELVAHLAAATDAVGRLDGVTTTLPNADLFVAMYVRREAVLSSQIEGTQSTLDDVLAFELDPSRHDLPADVGEVVNYVRAMNHGLQRLQTLPLSLRLLREIHAELLPSGRGSWKDRGEFRTSQNWIGPEGATLRDATFVPPAPDDMHGALGQLEKYLHADHGDPPLIECGLAHSQFETIHPFLDGNGRVGRLLITFLLVQRNVLHRPLLYLSHFLRRRRSEYYDRLMRVREAGDWEGWLGFFLEGIATTAREATETARAILALRERHRLEVDGRGLGINGLRLVDLLFERPLVDIKLVAAQLDVTYNTANRLVGRVQGVLVDEITGGQRNRAFRYTPYLQLFEDDATPPDRSHIETTAGDNLPDAIG